MELNKTMLMQYQSKKEAKEDPIDWDEFFREYDDDEAGPQGGGSEVAGRWVAQLTFHYVELCVCMWFVKLLISHLLECVLHIYILLYVRVSYICSTLSMCFVSK